MLAMDTIREELMDIRYYYTRKKVLDEAIGIVGTNTILEKVERYNATMRTAPPQLYDLYVCLYTKNHTQESLAMDWGYSPSYIRKLNKKLLLFLQAQIKE